MRHAAFQVCYLAMLATGHPAAQLARLYRTLAPWGPLGALLAAVVLLAWLPLRAASLASFEAAAALVGE